LALDDVKKLIDAGKEKGYLAYNEVNDLIPNDVRSPENLDDVLATIGTPGIDVLERQPKLTSSVLKRQFEQDVQPGGGAGPDLVPSVVEQTDDPVRIYLREMGVVPLLTREEEVDIAKRIERGQRRVLKALSRSPIVIRQVLAIGEDLKRGVRSIKEIVVFDEEEITEKVLQNGVKDTTCRIDELQKHYKRASQLAVRLPIIPAEKKAREYRRCRCGVGREIVRISLIIRNLGLTNFERERLIDRVNKTVDIMRSLDRQVSDLESKIESTRSEELKKDYRKTQRRQRADLERLECDAGVSFKELHPTQREMIQDEMAGEQAKQDVSRPIADQARPIRLPVHMVESVNKLIRVSRQLVQELGREPRSAEIAKHMDIPAAKVRKVLKIMEVPISLARPHGEEGDSHLSDFIEDRAVVSPAEAVISVDLKERTEHGLRPLIPRAAAPAAPRQAQVISRSRPRMTPGFVHEVRS